METKIGTRVTRKRDGATGVIVARRWKRVDGRLTFIKVWEGQARNKAEAKRLAKAS